MVFESIVADLLNKYLGEYVENLDRSQLQIGIWGGDIVLQNLVLKQSALDELDLPVRTVYGVLEKLVLKIPWKNLYRDPVEAAVERLYLLAVPNQEVKYDPVKEERWAQDAKQSQLLKVEAAKKWEAEKDLLKQDDSFVEKLSTQIIKNVQVKIGEIHIRYEDRVSSLGHPFALGITLHNLSVQTTDANWTKAVKDEASQFIFKELSLDGLSVYLNSDPVMFTEKSVTEMLQLFKDGIAAKERKPNGYEYMLGPINSAAKLKINPRPELDGSNYSIPKVQLHLELEKLAICISKNQYRDIMLLLESMDWMMRATPYRKYRPFVPSYAGHYKEWWKFAYKCILEDEVRRKQRNWDWNFMKQHRSLCKSYAENYRQKLTTKKVPAELTIQLQEMESQLDVFNIVLIRQRIEVQIERDLEEEKRQKQQRKGWFSSWWGGAAEAEAVQPGSAAELAKKIEEVMTPDEKAKLYRAIDYQENSTPTIYPSHFIENSFSFKMRSLEIEIRDTGDKICTILHSSLQEVAALVEQRMAGQALKANVKITKFTVAGLAQGNHDPQLVSSKLLEDTDSVLLDVTFETKPLDESCDQRLRVLARPLSIIYDAATVNSILDLFKPPETPALQNKIQAAIPVSMPVLKEMSVLGLQYAVDKHSVFDVNMDIMPSQILIPQNGLYKGTENLLVVNLGRMTVTTASKDSLAMDVRKMHLHGKSEDHILQEMISRSYTKFTLKLEDVQVLLAYNGEDWKAAIQDRLQSPMHVIMPINLSVTFHQCMVTDDPRLPKMKICAELGNIDIQLSEERFLNLINLPNSIPFNVDEPIPLTGDSASHSSQVSLFRTADADAAARVAAAKNLQLTRNEKEPSQPLLQVTDLEAKFVLECLTVKVHENNQNANLPLLTFRLLALEAECVKKTFDLNLLLSIGGIDLKQRYESADIDVIGTPMTSGQDQYLFTVRYTQVEKNSPELRTVHKSVLKLVKANFSSLKLLVHQEATLRLIAFANSFQSRMDNTLDNVPSRTSNAGRKGRNLPTIIEDEGSFVKSKPTVKKRKKKQVSSTIDLKVVAELQTVEIRIETKARPLSSLSVQGLVFGAVMHRSQTEINANLKDFVVLDLLETTRHKKILSIVDEEALSAQIVMFNDIDQDDPDAVDMSVVANMACVHVIYLNLFVSSLTSFLNNFQAAQAAVYEASAAAAEVAKQNAREAYTKATRMSLDIELKAPIVVFPVNSQSFDALLMDFGRLTIKNSFESINVQKEYPAVLDKIQLGLLNVKMSRVRLDKSTHQVIHERMLLKPISFTLSVIRNLSSSWYNGSPDLDLSGKINSINLSLSEADYSMVMQALSENMSEGNSEDTAIATVNLDSRSSIQTARPSVANIPSNQMVAARSLVSQERDKKVHVFMVFKFTMDSLVINLYSGGTTSFDQDIRSDEQRLKAGLACFTLYVLSVKGQMLSDNSLSTSVRLVDCLLDDTRVGREGKITRLMESKAVFPVSGSKSPLSPTGEASKRTMLDVTVRMKPNDMFVDVRIFSFNLIVSIDYLLKLSSFFVGNEAVKPVPSNKSVASAPSGAISRTTVGSISMEASVAPLIPDKRSESVMTINVRLEKPDILLVEAMDDLETNALVLNCEFQFNVRQIDEVLSIQGALEDLQLFTCCFNPLKRAETKSPVLQPTRINVAGSRKPGQGLHMEVISSNIKIAVTPGTLELLNRCQATLTAKHGSDSEDERKEIDYSDIWGIKSFKDTDFWFLKTEEGQDAAAALCEDTVQLTVTPITPLSELIIVTMPSIVITVEAGVGNKTLPMILLETNFHGAIRDFSSLMQIESSLNVQMWYYNSRLALWEPLIEPVETNNGGQVVHVPWELKMEVEFNDVNGAGSSLDESVLSSDGEAEVAPALPVMNVSISSKENLELTVTKTSLDVVKALGEAFQSAMKDGLPAAGVVSGAPYQIRNHTGLPIEVDLAASSFKLSNQMENNADNEVVSSVILEVNAKVELELKEGAAQSGEALALKSSSGGTVKERFLSVLVIDKQAKLQLPVIRADKRYFSLQQKGDTSPLQWGLVSDVQVEDGGFIVSLRSIIQVHNHFNVAVNVYYMTSRGNEVESVGAVEPGKQINLPLKAVYTPTSELFFSVEGYSVSIEPFAWRDLQKTLAMSKLLQCNSKRLEDVEPFFIKVVGETEQVFYENTSRHTIASTCYNIHLRPAVILKNFLPLDLCCGLQGLPGEVPLKAGERMQIPTAEPGAFTIMLKIPNYLEKEWTCKNPIRANPAEFAVWEFESFDSNEKVTLGLGVHTVSKNGSMVMALYAPFWMINKTGLMLSYRHAEEVANVLYHPANFKGPVLLSYRSSVLHSKKKAALKIENGDWSSNFPLDVAGSSGQVSCKVDGVTYQVGLHIQLNSNSLTKQVTFTPFHVLVNNAPFAIECREDDRPTDDWIKVASGACVPFWPKSSSPDAGLRVRVCDTLQMSGTFSYSNVYTVLLRLDNKYGGLNVDVQMTEGGVFVSFTAYEAGLAPALVINHTLETVKIWETGSDYMKKLAPKEMVLFAWEKPAGQRSLCWSVNKSKEVSDNLRKDGIGEVHPEPGKKMYWVSFLDGIQRILLLTIDPSIARDAQSAGEIETPSMAVSISIHGLGVSLVNSATQQELVYIGIASSGVIWETRKLSGSRFKPLNVADGQMIEDGWEKYNRELQIGNTPNPRMKLGKYEVDFELEQIISPSKRVLRRSFQTGLWIQRKVSSHQEHLHVKVNRLQIDNQMADCIFPVVLAPIPPPRSVAATSVLKPFIEMSVVKRLTEHSPVQQYKYCKALVQEFHIKVDIGFLNAILSFFEAEEVSDSEELKQFANDTKVVDEPLMSHVALQSSAEQKNFYDLLHFSPLKIHVSFSLGDGASSQNMPRVLSVLMQSLGVTLTDMNDVVFKLAYLERQYVFLTQGQLQSEATMHYTGQLLKQLYVLVLGLDVIGNPFGLAVGLTKGVEDLFYEPFQGAIQGPGEFAEGVMLGVRSLFGHTVGGAAGAASRITGTIGKGLAALTFDKDYIRKRRENLNKRPANLQTGIAQSGKGLVMGVVDGFTGVITKPISGAKQEGVEGFFKGVGKGVAGLITRPTSGIVDFASGSLSAVKRATEMTDEVVRLRPPRYFQPDGLVRPYIRHEAEGSKILHELEKGRYNSTDTYIYHVAMTRSGKEILLLTDKRVAYVKTNDIFGGWQVDWTYTWASMAAPPKVMPDGIYISTGEHKKKTLGIFGSSENGKMIIVPDEDQKKWLVGKMEDLHRKNT